MLNNPKTFHALTLEMIHCMQDVLTEWYKDDTMQAILVKSSGDSKKPAFCAGGDVKKVYLSGLEKNNAEKPHGQGHPGLDTADFFRHEYAVNYLMATARKPQISIWNGVVMGGGAGISVHGKYRVATENALFAMPETNIGLFPDVGSMYWMPRVLSEIVAVYLALTGQRLKPEDLLYTGLATHYVPAARLEELEDALVLATKSLKPTDTRTSLVAPVLMSFHENSPIDPLNSHLAQHSGTIDKIFGILADRHRGVEDIIKALENMDSSFGKQTLETIHKMSPTSLKITLEGLRRGAKVGSIGDCLKMEFRMVQACMRNPDFFEGIRAVLVDKDHSPKWKPGSLERVTPGMVASYFGPIEHEWEPPAAPTSAKL